MIADQRDEAADLDSFLDVGKDYFGHRERRAAAMDRAHSKGDREKSADDRAQLSDKQAPGRDDGVEMSQQVDTWDVNRRSVDVLDTTMSFVDTGDGPPVLFLHGNPTSSYLWRHVLPAVTERGYRGVAVDLIGMGHSGPSHRGYRLVDHLEHVDAFIEQLDLRQLVIVGHDWGGVMALDIARRQPDRVTGVAVMESHLHPIATWHSMKANDREMFSGLRGESSGERTVLDENFFIEKVLPSGISRRLTAAVHDAYREPFPDRESRAPILAWVREIPIEGAPADVTALVLRNQTVLSDPAMPVLLLHGEPGSVVTEAEVRWCSAHGRALTIASVGAGTHFLPEDRPAEIGAAVIDWLARRQRPDNRTI